MLTRLLSPLVHLFYPHCCELCGTDLPATGDLLCLRCWQTLPVTGFHRYPDNPVANIFNGRVTVQQATATYYYTQSSGVQQLIHRFKYRQRPDIAVSLGKQTGYQLSESTWIPGIDFLVPVPLFPHKEKLRGYNQATQLANGIAQVIALPVYPKTLSRLQFTATQTRKGRAARWQNVAAAFQVNGNQVNGSHVLLVDDVITTGATTEACCTALVHAGARVSVCCIAFAWS
ncbi:ComF family protein [Chitinophaga polysaccharea]|uniref:ComF family protein n=1 Tax=Chitinophaga TaxID=79328 RepID=UPI0014559625|nr:MULTISPECIES: ComF family protein [Chitinophaga]NLR59970.1 ComF family protein [Chitinophaga polysaccharea]NLU94199.1 ComF family protein [Chitinophaga sp. Ak27]